MNIILRKIKELLIKIDKELDEQCPNCGYYCTGKTIFCTKGRE